jgi:iron complex outermembrane receptor protein
MVGEIRPGFHARRLFGGPRKREGTMSKKLFQGSLLASTMIAGVAFASPAFAQDPAVEAAPTDQTEATQETPADTPDVDPGVDTDEAIVVTGSRIVSPNIVSLAPVQVIGEADIDQSGAVNVQEVLLENPVFGTPALARTNSAFLTSGAGAATVDLRDLGSDRTLVLINSRRVIAGLPGTATVDLNMIPAQFVDRIDILTGGASSLYGSDAIAGVVNFLYKRNFEGLLVEGQYGITHRGDSGRYQVSLTGGGNFAEDRGNVMIHLGYTNEDGLLSRQRKNTRVDDFSEFFYTYDTDDFGVEREPFFSSFPPQGRFSTGDLVPGASGVQQYTFTFAPQTGALQPCATTNATVCGSTVREPSTFCDLRDCDLNDNGIIGEILLPSIGGGVGPTGFNRQHFRTLAVPVERYLFATRGTFEVTDAIGAFAEATYAKTTSSRIIEPFPMDSADLGNGGIVAIETLVDPDGAGPLLPVATLNPFVPAAFAALATDLDGDGLRDMTFARRLSEVGNRSSESTRDVYRVVVGLEGKILNDRFNWDISYNYGQTSENQTSEGAYNVQNFRTALAGIPDVNDVDNDGDTTDVVCADPIQRELGCVAINIFGEGSITPDALAWIVAQQNYATKISQQVWAANLSGTVMELPAGPLGVAVGAEYRKETSQEDWDALTNAGLNASNALPDTEGSFNVKELFGEVNVPVLGNMTGVHALNLRAAGRLSDYSTVGAVETYSVGADYSPIQDLRFRATYAKSVRAPNIGELFTGPSQTFPPGIQDPCANITLATPGPIGTNCRADPGVLLNVTDNGAFTLTQADIQGISGFNSGNPNLDVERSTSKTAGVVFAPRNISFLRGFTASADYYDIEIKDAIVAPPRQFILEQCYEQGVTAFCDLVTRRPGNTGSNSAGSIEFIDAPLVNGGALKVKGLDFTAAYRTGLDALMAGLSMNARVAWTHILDAYVIPVPGSDKDQFDGEIGTARDRVNGTIALNTEKVGVSFSGTYIGKSYEDDQFLATFDLDDDAISVPAEFYLDTQVTFTPLRSYEFFFGVDNILDNDAPNLLSGTTFNNTGSDTAAAVYDIFGRRYYAGVRARF